MTHSRSIPNVSPATRNLMRFDRLNYQERFLRSHTCLGALGQCRSISSAHVRQAPNVHAGCDTAGAARR